MQYEIVLLEGVKSDLVKIVESMSTIENNYDTASNFLNKFDLILKNLSRTPYMYRTLKFSYKTHNNYKRVIINKHSIFYYIEHNKVIIYRILSNYQDYLFNQKVSQLKEDTFEYSAV